jgi:two-component system response regulator MtrA
VTPYTAGAVALFHETPFALTALRGQAGCEAAVVSNLLLRRDQLGCPALAPDRHRRAPCPNVGRVRVDVPPSVIVAGWQAGVVTARVLVVEDDSSVREAVTLVLETTGFEVTAVADGSAAISEAVRSGVHDLVLLDLMLPGVSGLDVCREIRRSSNVPIVMLTARAETAEVVVGLELGADDYITKPFEPIELAARVRAVLRRSSESDVGAHDVLQVRDVRVDEGAFRAFRADEELALTATEFRLLAELVRHAGLVLTREVLLERVWGYDYLGDSRLVDMAVMRLREKLGDSAEAPGYVSTVRGVGYRFEVD